MNLIVPFAHEYPSSSPETASMIEGAVGVEPDVRLRLHHAEERRIAVPERGHPVAHSLDNLGHERDCAGADPVDDVAFRDRESGDVVAHLPHGVMLRGTPAQDIR